MTIKFSGTSPSVKRQRKEISPDSHLVREDDDSAHSIHHHQQSSTARETPSLFETAEFKDVRTESAGMMNVRRTVN